MLRLKYYKCGFVIIMRSHFLIDLFLQNLTINIFANKNNCCIFEVLIGKANNGYDFTPTGNSACGELIKNKVL